MTAGDIDVGDGVSLVSTAVIVTVALQYSEYDSIGQNNVFERIENEAA